MMVSICVCESSVCVCELRVSVYVCKRGVGWEACALFVCIRAQFRMPKMFHHKRMTCHNTHARTPTHTTHVPIPLKNTFPLKITFLSR